MLVESPRKAFTGLGTAIACIVLGAVSLELSLGERNIFQRGKKVAL